MAKLRGAAVQGREVAWSKVFKAMGERTRLSILLKIIQNEQCVADIAKALKMDVQKVSFHLVKLRYAGLVAQERQGQRMLYRINPALVKKAGDGMVLDVDGCVLMFSKRG